MRILKRFLPMILITVIVLYATAKIEVLRNIFYGSVTDIDGHAHNPRVLEWERIHLGKK